jgi:hypothetical protein
MYIMIEALLIIAFHLSHSVSSVLSTKKDHRALNIPKTNSIRIITRNEYNGTPPAVGEPPQSTENE